MPLFLLVPHVSEADISFGDLEEAQPREELRPDENMHFCVASVHDVRAGDLPIYVDIDVMRDMEVHALSDTRVELGGVMLGGQYMDRDGNPFVVVTDSLRAEHYEATKGSFKFTHETWEQISRQRDEFPEDVEMVGWYHTHPSWGVFLSGMDDFICRNFFNRPLDLALVIDPESGDRGMFQWTEGPNRKTKRTGGFYLIGSRYREEEVVDFANQLRGKLDMPYERTTSSGSSTVVNVAESQPNWMPLAVMSMMSLQMIFLALIAWKILFPGGATEGEIAERLDKIEEVQQIDDREAEVKARTELLNDVVANLGGGADVVSRLAEAEMDREQMRAAAISFTAQVKELDEKFESQKKKTEDAEKEAKKDLADLKKELEKTKANATANADASKQLISDLQAALKKHDPENPLLAKKTPGGDAEAEKSAFSLTSPVVVGGVILVLGIVIGCGWLLVYSSQNHDEPLDDDREMFRMSESTAAPSRPSQFPGTPPADKVEVINEENTEGEASPEPSPDTPEKRTGDDN